MEKIENRQELEETFFHKGFPRELAGEVLNALLQGNYTENAETKKLELAVEHFTEIKGDELGYRLHVAYDPSSNKAYLNTYDAAILNHPEGTREHNFLASSLITSTEAHRMLKYGKKVAVNKDLFNKERQKYNVWLSIDVEGAKDEKGNYPVISYHENYFKKRPFDVQAALNEVHVPYQPIRQGVTPADYERDLKKAHILEVTITHNNEEQKGYLCVNPGERRIEVYDKDGKLIPSPDQKQSQGKQQQETTSGEVKKKPWGNQKVTSQNQGSKQHKGLKP